MVCSDNNAAAVQAVNNPADKIFKFLDRISASFENTLLCRSFIPHSIDAVMIDINNFGPLDFVATFLVFPTHHLFIADSQTVAFLQNSISISKPLT